MEKRGLMAIYGQDLETGGSRQVTELLVRWRKGDRHALDALIPLVYEELRHIAQHFLQREKPGHTLQSTALVHEAYVRMVGQNLPEWQSRAHFFGIAAQLMRQILVDHARARQAAKRGGDVFKISLDDSTALPEQRDLDLIALDDALKSLTELDPQQSRIVELRYFAGLTIEDTSEVLGISPATVKRDWATARAWLQREMMRGGS
jgi:RNA polymerase sigma factor (TIGR02999 family)